MSKINITNSLHKYIKIYSGSVRVKIERGDDSHLQHFNIRQYPSLEKAVEAAISWRDETHLKYYGVPVPDKIVQLKNKKRDRQHLDPESNELLPSLAPGLSYGFHRGRLLYVVVSYQEKNKAKRIRVPIFKYGLKEAINEALKKRVDEMEK